MHLTFLRRALTVALVLLLGAVPAFAQDYTSSTTSGKYEAPPTSGTTNLGMTANDSTVRVNLPFQFPYFGAMYSAIDVCSNGFLQIGLQGGSTAYSNTTFPVTVSGDTGMVAPYWDALNNAVAGNVLTWTKGSAPSRVFFVSWEGIPATFASAATSLTFQVQLFEGSGNILFAYKADTNPTTWGNNGSGSAAGVRTSYSCGIQGPGTDNRYVCPQGTSNSLRDHPPADYLLVPKTYTFTGTLVMDRIVSDANGIGKTAPQTNVPLAGLPVQVLRADGTLGFQTTTNASGVFSVTTYAMVSATAGNGSLVVVPSNSAAVVRTSAIGPTLSHAFKTNVAFTANTAYGTVAINATSDANGEKRAPMNIALVLQQARDWAAALTTDTIPQLEVYYDPSAGIASAYSKAVGMTGPWLRIGSAVATNPDAWDAGVIRRLYARHLLASIAVSPSTAPDARWDAVSDAENAFAEAFGAYVHAAISGLPYLVDGTGATTATVYDLEGPTPATRAGPDVTAWVAAALCDLLDGATGETWDRVDGTGTPGLRPFQVADSFTTPVTAAAFYEAWGAKGFAGGDLSRVFIRHGMLADDAFESNDDIAEPALLGDAGTRKSGLVLNLYNEDWIKVRLPSAAPGFFVDASWDRLSFDTAIDLEIRSPAGALLAVAADSNKSKPVSVSLGAVAAGDYLVRIVHKGGPRLPSYSVQAYTKLVLTQPTFGQWSAGRRYDLDLAITGGVPPYTISVQAGSTLPPGLTPDNAKLRISGTPAVAGTYSFGLAVTDSGSPSNTVSTLGSMTVNPALTIALAPYTGFPLGRTVDLPGLVTGGTPPLSFSLTAGGMPDGISLDPASMRYRGSATAAGSSPFSVAGTDSAGSASSGTSLAVVCVPFVPSPAKTPLAAGDAACGFWFDAVAGSRASIAVKTSPKAAQRTLKVTVLAPSGSVLAAKSKVTPGAAAIPALVCTESGRYYVVLASSAGDATELQGALRLTPPATGKARVTSFEGADMSELRIGALAGATLTLTCSGDAKSRLRPVVVNVLTPSGAPLAGYVSGVKKTARGFVLTLQLNVSGTWTVVVGSDGTASAAGTLSAVYRLKQPKNVVYSAD